MDTVIDNQPSLSHRPIYHYTSQRGLLGIITEKKIWATNILYMNDSTEFTYSVELAYSEVEKLRKISRNNEDISFLELINTNLRAMNVWLYAKNIYVCSFSTESDQLSQWRGYCPNGNGFSIGFNFDSQLLDFSRQQGFDLFECVYNQSDQSEIIKEFLVEALDKFHLISAKANLDDRTTQALRTFEFGHKFLRIASRFKHPKFSEEKEWRLISQPISSDNSQVRFREGKSMLIPFFEIKLTENKDDELLNITDIWIGPTPHPILSQSSIEGVLIANNVRGGCMTYLTNKKQEFPLSVYQKFHIERGSMQLMKFLASL